MNMPNIFYCKGTALVIPDYTVILLTQHVNYASYWYVKTKLHFLPRFCHG